MLATVYCRPYCDDVNRSMRKESEYLYKGTPTSILEDRSCVGNGENIDQESSWRHVTVIISEGKG